MPGATLAAELVGRAIKKAAKANWHQTKRGEFNKAYEPVYAKRGKRKIVAWRRRKNAPPNNYDRDYGFGTW